MAPLWIFVALGYLLLYAFASMQTQWLIFISNRVTGWDRYDAMSRVWSNGDISSYRDNPPLHQGIQTATSHFTQRPTCRKCRGIERFVGSSAIERLCDYELWLSNFFNDTQNKSRPGTTVSFAFYQQTYFKIFEMSVIHIVWDNFVWWMMIMTANLWWLGKGVTCSSRVLFCLRTNLFKIYEFLLWSIKQGPNYHALTIS